ncbi:hypothetical protein FRB97_009182 [Tulasnella sp. 331]|nr:hypothetical protein FRB97_009182 [Tulasnella sp. 331]
MVDLHLDRSRTVCRSQQWIEARLALDEAKTAFSDEIMHPEWRTVAIVITICSKDWDEAIRSAKQGAPHIDILAVLSRVIFLTNYVQPCTRYLKAALRLDADHAQAAKLFRRVKAIGVAKDACDRVFAIGDNASAIAKYTKALEMGGTDIEGAGGLPEAAVLSNRAAA